jgi:ATP-dependent protease ClpP protease subunit
MSKPPIEASVAFSSPITQESSTALVTKVTEHAAAGATCVKLEISTPGGVVASGLELYNTLRSMPIEMVTETTGEIASMGNVLFLAGDRRLASPQATFVMHTVAVELGGRQFDLKALVKLRAGVEQIAGDATLLRELDLGIARLGSEEAAVRAVLLDRTKLSEAEITDLAQNETSVTASRALEMGFVHEVIAPPAPPRDG